MSIEERTSSQEDAGRLAIGVGAETIVDPPLGRHPLAKFAAGILRPAGSGYGLVAAWSARFASISGSGQDSMVAGQASYTTCNPESSRDAGQREEFLGRPVIRLPATLLCAEAGAHAGAMFIVDEATAEAIRIAFESDGELSAVAELRRHFPLITDNEDARRCVRTIAGWKPLLQQPRSPLRG